MGLMAGITREPAGVICSHDLGKALGLGAIGFVAAGANECRVELWRLDGCGIVRMACQGAVAGLAGYDNMLALFLLVYHVGMASLTGIVAREGSRPGRCFGNRSPAIMTVLSKASWNDGGA